MATFEFIQTEKLSREGPIYHYLFEDNHPTDIRIAQCWRHDEELLSIILETQVSVGRWMAYSRYFTIDAAKKGAIALQIAWKPPASGASTMVEKIEADYDERGHMTGRYIGLTKPKANARQTEDPDFEPIEAYPSIKKDQVRPDGGPAFPQMRNTGLVEMSKDGRTHMDKECTGGMTIREYAAIHLRVPKSGNSWLDEIIREANEREE